MIWYRLGQPLWLPLFFVVMCFGADKLKAQMPLGYSDLHHSGLYAVFRSGVFSDFDAQLDSFRKADAHLVFLSIGVPRFNAQGRDTSTNIEAVLAFFKGFRAYCQKKHPDFQFVGSAEELNAALASKKIALAYGLEGACLLDHKIEYVDSLYAVGLRMLSPAHWFHNQYIIPKDSSIAYLPIHDESRLSEAGRLLIEKLISKGILIDVSHLRQRVFWEVVAINNNRTPLIASHANAYALTKHSRNLRNKQLRAIAQSGGYVGLCLHQPLLERSAIEAHIRHIARLVGKGHICWGSDYGGNTTPPKGLESITLLQKKIPLAWPKQQRDFLRGLFSGNALGLFYK